jgi:hypothetical protein
VLRDGRTSKAAKSAAGSALAQARGRATSPTGAKKGGSGSRSGLSTSKRQTVAASSLTQVRNPRSGHFVKIDTSTGRIISHKKTSGAYKGVPIAKTSSSRK